MRRQKKKKKKKKKRERELLSHDDLSVDYTTERGAFIFSPPRIDW
jgi:hypothetical protein